MSHPPPIVQSLSAETEDAPSGLNTLLLVSSAIQAARRACDRHAAKLEPHSLDLNLTRRAC